MGKQTTVEQPSKNAEKAPRDIDDLAEAINTLVILHSRHVENALSDSDNMASYYHIIFNHLESLRQKEIAGDKSELPE